MSQYGNAILHDGEYILNKDGTAYKVKALTSTQWRTIAAHEKVYREMAEQQAESRDARRNRAVNRPRGRACTDGDGE